MKTGTICLALMLLVVSAYADTISLYKGQNNGEGGFNVVVWGSGAVDMSKDTTSEGSHSIKITSRGFFSGALLAFDEPIDVTDAANDPTQLLTFSIYVIDTTGGSGVNVRPAKTLRIVLRTDDGNKTELYIPMPPRRIGQTTWTTVGVPLKAFPKFSETSKKIKHIRVSADVPSVFYLGSVKVATDNTPITAEAFANEGIKEITIANNETARFFAVASAGASVLDFSWDFDDSDGIQPEAEGFMVDHMFRHSGLYTVTLTVKDMYGNKKEVQSKVKVKITL